MSQSIDKTPIICTYKIDISDTAKQAIADFSAGIKSASKLISAYKASEDDGELRAKAELCARQAAREALKNRRHGGLLAAMAASDTVEPEPEPEPALQQLGQWAFEGCDEKWQSAAINDDGQAYRHNLPLTFLYKHKGVWISDCFGRHESELIPGKFDLANSLRAVQRDTINDVDYLTDSDSEHDIAPPFEPELRGMAATLAVAKDMAMPSKDNLQSLFIKNLAELLIQRMHSLNRFSEDDYEVCGSQFEHWDIVVGQYINEDCFAVVTGTLAADNINCSHIDVVILSNSDRPNKVADKSLVYFYRNDSFRTIRQDELQDFRAALEACYAK